MKNDYKNYFAIKNCSLSEEMYLKRRRGSATAARKKKLQKALYF